MASPQITEILLLARDGNPQAKDQIARWLADTIREELRRLKWNMPRDQHDATDIVSEVFLKLLRSNCLDFAPNRRYLAVAAARAVREVLVDEARKQTRKKRGAGLQRLPFEFILDALDEQGVKLIPLNDALIALSEKYPRQAEVVELRFFGGNTHKEIAEILGIGISTVESEWRSARGWLYRALADEMA